MLKRITRITSNVSWRCFSFTAATTAASTTATNADHQFQSIQYQCARGFFREALTQFFALCNSPFDAPTYSALFLGCSRNRDLRLGQTLHCHLLTHHPNHPPDLYLDNHIVNLYAKCGHLDYARHLFDGMRRRNIVSWTALVSGYSQYDRPDECFAMFADMLAHIHPTEFAYASVLTCCDYDRGRQVHSLAMKTGSDACIYVSNALIAMYFKNAGDCGYDRCDNAKDEALAVFQIMENRDPVSWNSMLAGFQFCGVWTKTIELFNEMHRDGITFDRASLLSTISSLCDMTDNNVNMGLSFCLQLHSLAIRTGLIREVEVSTVLVRAHSTLGGDVADCLKLFVEMGNHRDVVCWTEIITVFAENNPEKSLSLFYQLRQEGAPLDRYNLLSVLRACSNLMSEQHASSIHLLVIRGGFVQDNLLANALIHCYSRCGGSAIGLSRRVFKATEFRDVVTWNTMLKAYAMSGMSEEALDLYSVMDMRPDSVTFVSLLGACSHAGMVQEGVRIFEGMTSCGVVPELDHYACMVDLYGRAGLIQEAENLIRRMPMEPDSVVWITLLGACRKHNNTELAEVAAAKLREMDPGNHLGYVLMSNIYLEDGSFNEALLLREKMKGSRMQKNPGLSWT